MIDTDVQPSLFTKGLNLKDKNIRDIANAYGWDENMLKKVEAWSQVGTNIRLRMKLFGLLVDMRVLPLLLLRIKLI